MVCLHEKSILHIYNKVCMKINDTFGIQRSVVPTRGEELEQFTFRKWGVCSDASFPSSFDCQLHSALVLFGA